MNLSVIFVICAFHQLACGLMVKDATSSLKDQHISEVKSFQKKHNDFVGFSAWARDSQLLNEGQIAQFAAVLSNEGDMYDQNTGIFTCAVDGIYLVSATICQNDYGTFVFNLRTAAEIFLSFYSSASIEFHTVSNSAVVSCDAGESIFIEAQQDASQIYGQTNLAYSTFSVILMEQTGLDASEAATRHDSFIGSTAYKTVAQDYSRGDTIDYDSILYNAGGFFDPITNTFQCPLAGIYFINVAAYKSSNGSPMYICVETSNLPVPVLHLDDPVNGNTGNGISNNVVVSCPAGETIKVTATGMGGIRGGGSPDPDYDWVLSSFTIMYMAPDLPTTSYHDSFVGFSAFKRDPQTYDTGDYVTFGGVYTSSGDSYNPTTSIFTCPVAGIYFVSVNLKQWDDQPLSIDAVYQTLSITRSAITDVTYSGNTASNMALVRAFSGDEISVQGSDAGSVYGDESNGYTTFTVVLMYEL